MLCTIHKSNLNVSTNHGPHIQWQSPWTFLSHAHSITPGINPLTTNAWHHWLSSSVVVSVLQLATGSGLRNRHLFHWSVFLLISMQHVHVSLSSSDDPIPFQSHHSVPRCNYQHNQSAPAFSIRSRFTHISPPLWKTTTLWLSVCFRVQSFSSCFNFRLPRHLVNGQFGEKFVQPNNTKLTAGRLSPSASTESQVNKTGQRLESKTSKLCQHQKLINTST